MIINEENSLDKNRKKYKDYSEIKQNPDYEQEESNQIKVIGRYNNSNQYSYNNNFYSKFFLLIFAVIIILLCVFFFTITLKKSNIFINETIILNDIKNQNQTKTNINNTIYKNEINKNYNDTIKLNLENSKDKFNNNTYNSTSTENKKISIAFVYSTLYGNGIARFITVTANYLIETGKYDIYLITGKKMTRDYKYNSKIKRVYAHDNRTLLHNFTKNVTIDFFILQNVLGDGSIKLYKSFGKKVICIFHGLYMSAMFHGGVSSYRNWDGFDHFDSFIFISYDDYYFYKNLGYKNEIFIPNLYTFEPSKIKDSNLTTHNIMMLGRASDKVKGYIYAVKTLPYIVKEVPDAILNIVSSNYNVKFLKDAAKQLGVSNNLVINYFTENITEVFWNSSVFMYTSLSEAFPMAMNEAKAHGLPIVAFNVHYSIPYQSGVINVDMLDCEALARETVKLLKDYDYRKKMGKIAKESLNKFKNNETVEMWGRLFNSLLEGEEAYRRLQNEIEKKYYNEESAREHAEKHYQD